MVTLNDLPPEVLSQVVTHLPNAKCVSGLALTSRRLHGFVEKDAWRVFALNRFLSIPIPPYWKDGAHALATLSRNFDRRAFIARRVEPNKPILRLPSGNLRDGWRKKSGQSMGYQAMVDSYEVWNGGDWRSRKEVIAWGAGADLILKTVSRNRETDREFFRSPRDRGQNFESALGRVRWIQYREEKHIEGRDDIVAINLLGSGSECSHPDLDEEVLIGRANGDLSLLRLGQSSRACVLEQYDTSSSSVRAMDRKDSHLTACLGDNIVALYPLRGDNERLTQPDSQVKCVSKEDVSSRNWGCRFISNDLIAVGRGPSRKPVHIYQIRETGLAREPLRRFGRGFGTDSSKTSVYPVIGVPTDSGGMHVGLTLLSGGYDGIVRLHDLRSPNDFEAQFRNEDDCAPIYSLTTIGSERVVAGAATNSAIKLFDMRMHGARAYSYSDASIGHSRTPSNQGLAETQRAMTHESDPANADDLGWTIFCAQTHRPSPVYSLSRPSPSSPSLYVGLENEVIHLNFTSLLDGHPDSLFRMKPGRRGSKLDTIGTWSDAKGNSLDLVIWEHCGLLNGGFKMLKQKSPHQLRGRDAQFSAPGSLPGYDERLTRVK